MVDHNVATDGAQQRSTGLEFSLIKVGVHQEGSSASIAITPYLGSPLSMTPCLGNPLSMRQSHESLNMLLQSFENAELEPQHFSGRNVYAEQAATFVDPNGSIVRTLMSTHMRDNKAMIPPGWLGTMIICLSNYLSKIDLAEILARALLVHLHGCVEPHLRGDFGIIRSAINEYAVTVLSFDSGFDELKSAKQSLQAKAYQMYRGTAWHEMFSPPRSCSEQEDFVEMLFQILSAPGSGAVIYTRSVKLLGLANQLAYYGWRIDILALEEHGIPPIMVGVQQGVLMVVYCLEESMHDHCIEAHARRGRHMRINMPGANFYPSISIKAAQWRIDAETYFPTGQVEEKLFLKGYEKVKIAWEKSVRSLITTVHQDHLLAQVELYSWTLYAERTGMKDGLFNFMGKFDHIILRRNPLAEAILDILSKVHAKLDWEKLGRATQESHVESSNGSASSAHRISIVVLLQFLLGSLSAAQNLTRPLLMGGILAVLDSLVVGLISIPAECLVRVPVGESIEKYVHIVSEYGKAFLDPQRGQKIRDAFILCAVRLAGVNPEDPRIAKTTHSEDIIGFWNGQQGILLTPVWERSLLSDLPEGHRFPMTLHNRPIIGIPTDSGGWIKSGKVPRPIDRKVEHFTSIRPAHSKIILQYRAHFEVDATELVAAVYINGVFFSLLSLKKALSHYYSPSSHGSVNSCNHSIPERSAPPPQAKYISIRNLDTCMRVVPDTTCNDSVIISPHGNTTSRLFAYLLYSDKSPVLQDGCFKCALLQAGGDGSIVISRLVSETASIAVWEQEILSVKPP